ncbi:alpha/beta hydrolase-fold protein [Mucilaginibacter sp. UYCu711]|uniref:alpha/beta hydrolase n=1 Tax=Mucilaginibacter sp. UYCu711 TaxID=3156339 RepID=UPI003D21635E
MKLLLFLCFVYSFSLPLHAQQNEAVNIATIDSIQSKILHEKRKIWIHLPTSASTDKKKKYPVLYLLDAEWNFNGVAGMIDFLSAINGNNFCPEMIIVGVPNTNRTRDLTPTKVTNGLFIDQNMAANSGGGEAFTAFMEKELVPHIDSLYHTLPYRMLVGHSLGGILVINTLVHHPHIFKAYLAIEPSMWWDHQKLLKETAEALQSGNYTGQSVFLAMANTLPPGMDTAAVQKDTVPGTIHPRSILQLHNYLMRNPQNGLDASFKYYPDDTHSSAPLIATYDALHFIFQDYALKFQDSYFTDPGFKLAAYLQAHYAHISAKYGFVSEDSRSLLPPEDLVNNLGFFMMQRKQFGKAEEMFTMNIKNYPSGSLAYRYLGDLFAARGDKKTAVGNYRKALELKEDTEARKKLNDLQQSVK